MFDPKKFYWLWFGDLFYIVQGIQTEDMENKENLFLTFDRYGEVFDEALKIKRLKKSDTPISIRASEIQAFQEYFS